MAWRQLSHTLACLSKFPTLLKYKIMGITPQSFKYVDWILPIVWQSYKIFLTL